LVNFFEFVCDYPVQALCINDSKDDYQTSGIFEKIQAHQNKSRFAEVRT